MYDEQLNKEIKELFPKNAFRESILKDIHEISTSLLSDGQAVTVRNIREIWGKGSHSTISKYLRLRKAFHNYQLRHMNKGDVLSPNEMKKSFKEDRENLKKLKESEEFKTSSKKAYKSFKFDKDDYLGEVAETMQIKRYE
jgi:hypothetical protein